MRTQLFDIGQTLGLGLWTVVRYNGTNKFGQRTYLCRCSCGTEQVVSEYRLRIGRSKACRDCSKTIRFIKLDIGRVFDQWTVRKEDGTGHRGQRIYLCECSCGNTQSIPGYRLLSGRSTKCKACARTKGAVVKIGSTFGLWLVDRDLGTKEYPSGAKKHLWGVICTGCGRHFQRATSVLVGGVTSGCHQCRANPQNRGVPYRALFNNLVYSAKLRKIEVLISLEDFVRFTGFKLCHYCFAPLVWAKHDTQKNGQAYNLDRMDNSRVYARTKLVPCCRVCNMMKSNRCTYERWYRMNECNRRSALAERPEIVADIAADDRLIRELHDGADCRPPIDSWVASIALPPSY
jgi:hypothetical protein